MGMAISAADSPPVATLYSSGWNRWWLRRSIRVIRTSALARARAAARPPKPPPMITTWCCGRGGAVLGIRLAESLICA
jgi:hypothetical protein